MATEPEHRIDRPFQHSLPPTKAEQEAIAEAVSDADALIESLEQLIAKERHIKQGAMRELLTVIATILSDMDTEIAALETKLAKTVSLKQGMKHNLLTGRIRLV